MTPDPRDPPVAGACRSRLPMRLQVVCSGRLIAEVIVEQHMLDAFQPGGGVWERFARAKSAAWKPCGGAVWQRADLPRAWNVPVGAWIDWRDDPAERAQFEADAERDGWMEKSHAD